MFALGAEAAGLLLARRATASGLSPTLAWPLLVVAFAAGLAGARLFFVLLYPKTAGGWAQLPDIWHGGLVSYGGLAAGSLAAYAYVRRYAPDQALAWYDCAVVATLTAWGIGRIGNFIAGDSTGVSSAVWQVTYGKVPIQLFESLLCLGLAAWLWRRQWEPGRAAVVGAIGYFAGRLLIDTWRDEPVFLSMHASQWTSLALLVMLSLYAFARR